MDLVGRADQQIPFQGDQRAEGIGSPVDDAAFDLLRDLEIAPVDDQNEGLVHPDAARQGDPITAAGDGGAAPDVEYASALRNPPAREARRPVGGNGRAQQEVAQAFAFFGGGGGVADIKEMRDAAQQIGRGEAERQQAAREIAVVGIGRGIGSAGLPEQDADVLIGVQAPDAGRRNPHLFRIGHEVGVGDGPQRDAAFVEIGERGADGRVLHEIEQRIEGIPGGGRVDRRVDIAVQRHDPAVAGVARFGVGSGGLLEQLLELHADMGDGRSRVVIGGGQPLKNEFPAVVGGFQEVQLQEGGQHRTDHQRARRSVAVAIRIQPRTGAIPAIAGGPAGGGVGHQAAPEVPAGGALVLVGAQARIGREEPLEQPADHERSHGRRRRQIEMGGIFDLFRAHHLLARQHVRRQAEQEVAAGVALEPRGQAQQDGAGPPAGAGIETGAEEDPAPVAQVGPVVGGGTGVGIGTVEDLQGIGERARDREGVRVGEIDLPVELDAQCIVGIRPGSVRHEQRESAEGARHHRDHPELATHLGFAAQPPVLHGAGDDDLAELLDGISPGLELGGVGVGRDLLDLLEGDIHRQAARTARGQHGMVDQMRKLG
ncbi:MAG: hypothetical protein OZSIB_2568 [Candidatus Ozemobacter sibiricus]|uniref:Uncharacterized protein n=1 Tax=Candidatus Ozemobacter sibiricus TaxID=2268124 RepID=A0A367Z5Y0_9BACT|nr:MAG: hypothetical protein OZSIB_2568 [Candidatus Ozemobacter sibiricus]